MRPEIEAYLRENGAKYTTEALRQQLLRAGHEALDVDSALREFDAARAPQLAETSGLRSRFWLSVWGLNIVGVIVATIWAFQGPGRTYAGAVPVVLGIVLLIGLGISGFIGRRMLGAGLAVALIVPVLFTVVLTGVCMAMFGAPSTI